MRRRPLQREQQQPAMPSHQQRRRRSTLLRSFLLLQLLLALAVLVASGRPGPSSTPRSSGRRRLVHSRRLPAAWGETWEFEEDVLEPLQRLGTKVLDFVLRRQSPEEPHPLRMQRWTIYMRKFPFRRVVRHMQFYADGTCEVEAEAGGQATTGERQKGRAAGAPPSSSGGSGKRREKRGAKVQQHGGPRGKWKYDKYGLNWELEEGGLRHFYHAELIWHSFGDRPKMHCGVIVRNRGPRSLLPPWLFRPVVGIFHAYGNGSDTVQQYMDAATTAETRFSNY